ncbi:MAG TPA: hypothetical protein VF738_10075 [Rhodanobacter sp.]
MRPADAGVELHQRHVAAEQESHRTHAADAAANADEETEGTQRDLPL